MKDGRTHLAYKAEHVIDLDTELILAAEIYKADEADVDTIGPSITAVQDNLIAAEIDADIKEVVADKGYHSAELLEDWRLARAGVVATRNLIRRPSRCIRATPSIVQHRLSLVRKRGARPN